MLLDDPSPTPPEQASLVELGGIPVRLLGFDAAVQRIMRRAVLPSVRPLGVCSANLDHIRHFGSGSPRQGTLEQAASIEWMTLLDGAPLVAQARRLTGASWPRLAGSDLIGPLLDEAEQCGVTVGFLGGSRQVQELLGRRLSRERPGLRIAGHWAPDRSTIMDDESSLELAANIKESAPDILVIGLGKPRQELWASQYGHLTGAKVLLAFGAVIDFLAGQIQRAPSWMSEKGLEWAWRLLKEPRRLARRYLLEGPGAYARLRTDSSHVATHPSASDTSLLLPSKKTPSASPVEGATGSFLKPECPADIAIVIVTYDNADDIDPLISGLRAEAHSVAMKVVVADNSPDDATRVRLSGHADVLTVSTGGNLGYAGGINQALRLAGNARAFLILNPDLRVEPGAIAAMWRRMMECGSGMVVPLLLDPDGSVYPSLRREPSVTRALGDAAMGSRLVGRPGWLSEIDFRTASYLHPHLVEWATGAAMLISADAMSATGEWDEQFFLYSEETDYCHRLRAGGFSIWYEPAARMWHERGGSGQSPELMTLMTVNRVRYARKHMGSFPAALVRAAVLAGAVARIRKPGQRKTALALMNQRRWAALPHATIPAETTASPAGFPSGAVIIPAHNEAAVLGRTLDALGPVASAPHVDVIVACNGCTDGTEAIASRYPGVRVVRVGHASKTAALNAADGETELWPRIYLDADIELNPDAVRAVLDCLNTGSVLAARPAYRYDTTGASASVKAYYRARSRIPGNSRGLWGAGVFALSAAGHERLHEFPAFTGDDLYVDRLFGPEEKAVLAGPSVVVRTPRSRVALLAVLRRTYRGNAEQKGQVSLGMSTRRTFQELAHTVRGPVSAFDAGVYAAFAVTGRFRINRSGAGDGPWERDETSRR
ncbi:WecB/TagA/CpsF family glycosyltransferase [Paenarthrobacter nicotinovorans]|uniref:WecB/TagA/CpsF family glycosyltransferase n=1 Tax=Paenarthrobacter nicotinovorans TaxID=29320 RepID=UPI003822F05E